MASTATAWMIMSQTPSEVCLGGRQVTLPAGALYFPKFEDEPSLDMVVVKGRIIIGSPANFAIWLSPTRAIVAHSFLDAVEWCECNPVKERSA